MTVSHPCTPPDAELRPDLAELRRSLARLDPTMGPGFVEALPPLPLGHGPIDAALAGGLSRGALHEFAAVLPFHLGAVSGVVAALAARAMGRTGHALWITTDFACSEAGVPYGPGLDGFGLPSSRLILLRLSRVVDVLWAMEEALRCRALSAVIAELTSGAEADLTATRRLSLAARDGAGANSGLGLLLHHRPPVTPSAAATRWLVATAPSRPDRFGGLGRAAFDLTLFKNRRGEGGRWTVTWDHHEHVFSPAVSLAVAAPPLDRPDRAPAVRAG